MLLSPSHKHCVFRYTQSALIAVFSTSNSPRTEGMDGFLISNAHSTAKVIQGDRQAIRPWIKFWFKRFKTHSHLLLKIPSVANVTKSNQSTTNKYQKWHVTHSRPTLKVLAAFRQQHLKRVSFKHVSLERIKISRILTHHQILTWNVRELKKTNPKNPLHKHTSKIRLTIMTKSTVWSKMEWSE